MEKRIFKYPIQLWDTQIRELPEGAKVIHLDEQNGKPHLWAIVDPDAPTTRYTVHVLGTGQAPHFDLDKATHVGTYSESNGIYVWHVFIKPLKGKK